MRGLYWAMCLDIFGHAGAWAETLGVIAPLNEMMLQGYNHIINVFPNWPANVNASFKDFRMEGAFLVSAAWENGKVIDVEIVTHNSRPPSDGSGFVSECTWNVSGSVGHWGHVHRRTNQYRATLRIEPVDGVWKITALEVLDEVRLPS